MKTSTTRLLQLAIKGLELEKEKIEFEITALTAEMKGSARSKASVRGDEGAINKPQKRLVKLSAEERKRRSERMTLRWVEWRKKKAAAEKARGKKS